MFKAINFLKLLGVAVLLTDLGCASGVTVKDLNRSLIEIKSAIVKVIGDPEKTSPNNREFTSRYYPPAPDFKFDPMKSKMRLKAKITLLGDRRPYDLQVEVFREVKTSEGYSDPELDLKYSRDLSLDIRGKLHQSRDDRNFIDDFRPF